MMNDIEFIEYWKKRAKKTEKAIHEILSKYESSMSRVVILTDLLKKLDKLPIDIKDYFTESMECLQHGHLRAASIMSWAGFFQVFSEKLYSVHEKDIRAKRPKWNFKDLVELKENYAESQILDVAKEVKYINKTVLRILQGHLSTRNQCAHPTLYKPSRNTCIGYVDEMISRTIEYM